MPDRILIVEDDAIVAAHLQRLVQSMGCTVHGPVATGEDAVAQVNLEVPDAVLMDIKLRGPMTGVDAAEQIRSQHEVPIIYLTAYADDMSVEQTKTTQPYAYLTKPVREKELRASLQMALYKSRTERALRQMHQVLRALREVDQLLSREHDPQALLNGACRILVGTRGYRMAWFAGLDPGGGGMRPLASNGDGTDFLEQMSWAALPKSQPPLPFVVAAQTGQPVVSPDLRRDPAFAPWARAIEERDFVSAAAIPVRRDNRCFGVLSLFADRPEAFPPEEIDLLRELADDLAYGLRSLEHEADKRRTEQRLLASEALYQSLVENLPQCIFRKDAEGHITFVNQQFCAVQGRPQEELIGKTDHDLFPVALADNYRRDDLRVMATGETLSQVEAHERPDGARLFVQVVKTPIADETSRIVGVQGIFWDITDTKLAEDRLHRSREMLQRVMDNIPIGVFWKNRQDIYLGCNRQCALDAGLDQPEAIVGKTDADLPWHEAAAEHMAADAAVMNEDRPLIGVERTHSTARGDVLWVRVNRVPLHSSAGKVIGVLGTYEDITALREQEKALRLLSRAVEQSPVSIVITDQQGLIEYVNPRFTQVTGYTADEVRGKNPRVLKGGGTTSEEYAELWRTIAGGHEWRGEFHNRRQDGTLFWESASVSPVTDASGRITHFLAVKEDITATKLAREELQRAKEAAEAASRAKSDFLANMSHEIRTPMNGVIGMTSLLLDTPLDAEQREYAEIVRHSGESLLTLINDILDFSKIEAGRLDLEVVDFDLRALLEDTMDTLALRAQEKGLEFVCLVEPGLHTRLRGDPGRLRQVFTNLAGNAIKFTHAGEISVRVTVPELAPERLTLRVEVADTGIGISSEKLSLLFQPFSQVDASSTRKYGGTGLGLSISRRLVELMEGEIGVQSEPGSGSIFWFTVKLGRQTGEAATITEATDLCGRRVLVVDDNANNRRLLEVLLTSWGCDHTSAPGPVEALSLLLSASQTGRPFEAAILDMHMPVMDGRELARRIRAQPEISGIRLVMLTSLAERGEAERLGELRFGAYLTKPVKQAQLRKALRLVFGDANIGHTDHIRRPAVLPRPARAPDVPIRILVAEDNATNQKVAVSMLEKLSYQVDAVSNGREAIRKLETDPYDTVLMDCQMPELDGFDATRVIRDPASQVLDHDITIIAMTAHALKGDRERCLDAGMNDYISKPVQPSELLAALSRWTANPGAPLPPPTSAPPPASPPSPDSPPPVVAVSAPSAPPPVFDRPDMMERLMGDFDIARDVISAFLDDTPNELKRLEEALARNDHETARRFAHSLKGASANVGGLALRALAAEIESAMKTEQIETANSLVTRVPAEYDRLADALREFLAIGGAS